MKSYPECFVFIFFMLFIGCKDSTIKKTIIKNNPSNDTITINVNKLNTREDLYLRYDDDKSNELHYPYDKHANQQITQSVVSKSPLILNDDDVLGGGVQYVLLGNDKVNISDNANKLLKFTTNDSIRNNELNFFVEVQKNLKNFNYYKISKYIKIGDQSNQVFKEMCIYYKSSDYKFALKYTDIKYNDQIKFLTDYTKRHRVSLRMKEIFENIIYFNYTFFKLRLASMLISQNQKIDGETLNDISVFKHKINLGNFLYMPFFRASLSNYVIYLNAINKQKNIPVYDLIKQNFSGVAKDYLLFYAVNKAVIAQKYNQQLLNAFYKDCKNPDYLIEIKRNLYMVAPGEQSTLLDNNGNKTAFETIINQNKNKVIYIDFWASWCIPCMQQMPSSASLHEILKNYPIQFLYFSMDNSYSSWQTTSKQLKHNSSDNFLVANGFHSNLATRFNLTTIPKYIIISKAGKIVSANSRGPSENSTKSLLISLTK